MKNISIFAGWKEFKEGRWHIRLEDSGAVWHIYEKHGNAFIHAAVIRHIGRESNKALFARATAKLIRMQQDDDYDD